MIDVSFVRGDVPKDMLIYTQTSPDIPLISGDLTELSIELEGDLGMEVLYDSRVICEYLDTLAPQTSLVPAEGAARFRVLRLQALADGVLDAGILAFYEKNSRPAELHWAPWIDGQLTKVRQGLDALDREAGSFGPEVDVAQIATAAAVGWLEFRGVAGDVREGRAALFRWYDAFRARPSMKATEPKA